MPYFSTNREKKTKCSASSPGLQLTSLTRRQGNRVIIIIINLLSTQGLAAFFNT